MIHRRFFPLKNLIVSYQLRQAWTVKLNLLATKQTYIFSFGKKINNKNKWYETMFDSIIGHNQLNDENENKKLAHYYYMYCIIYTSKNCSNNYVRKYKNYCLETGVKEQ